MINVKDDFEHMGQWPCVRNALMYGIVGGAGIGAVRFLGSRRRSPLLASAAAVLLTTPGVHSAGNWAVATFVATAVGSR